MRSRSRAIALRCACALASFDALKRTSSPAKRSRRARSNERAERVIRSPDTVRRCRACATWPCSTRSVNRALLAAKRRKCACVLAFNPRGSAAPTMVQPLPRDRQQLIRRRQRARRGAKFVAAGFLAALPAHPGAPRQRLDFGEQVAAHRHRHFGRRRWRRRALVGGEIDQGDVGLVADRPKSAGSCCRRPHAPRSPR